MTIDDIIQVLNSRFEATLGKSLTPTEVEILEAAWDNRAYSDVASRLYISEGYIKNVASRLWQRLSDLCGETISKANFRGIIAAFVDIDRFNPSIKATVMIIDDLAANLDLLSQLLTEQQYRVRTLTSGKMALRSIRNNPPDLILLDIKMPEMDGFAVCETLKQEEPLAEIPIIFLSAVDEVFDKVKAFELGAVDYITKPFQAIEVLKRVETQLTLLRQHQQLKAEIDEHLQSEMLLYQSRSLLANVLNAAPDGIAAAQAVRDLVTGKLVNLQCVLANPRFAEMLGQRQSDLMGDRLLKELLEGLEPGLFAACFDVITTGEALETTVELDIQTATLLVTKLADGIALTLRA
ncbi:MAG: response regulator [Spirulina sp. SIO3F2]|nr:response regulator [Spirulina sp. SIO3F2]